MNLEDENHLSNCIDRPVFVIGTGRSGTTFLFNLLHKHPQFAWLDQYMVGIGFNKWDRIVEKLGHTPLLGHHFVKALSRPRLMKEPYEFWLKYMAGFNRPCRDLTAGDACLLDVTRLRQAVTDQITSMQKSRFITKYTGWSRIGLLDAAFPDAHFLNVIRDGRAVAWSLLHIPWWLGWRGPKQWRWGPLDEVDTEIWERSNHSFLILAGLQWKILMDNLREMGKTIGDRYLEVRYEDLVASPVDTILPVLQWAGLSENPKFIETLKTSSTYDANRKWIDQVDPDQKQEFETLLGETLVRYGYPTHM